MDSNYTQLYFIIGTMAFIIIFATLGLILFVKYLNRDSKDPRHTGHHKAGKP